jgi:predicted TIM-barrel fold metal-dependent hydrolase
MNNRLISTDDHLQEPPDLWTQRMSRQKWGDRIPQIRRNDDGTDGWFIDDKPFFKYGAPYLSSVQGTLEGRTSPKTWDEVPRITYVPSERVKAMDRDGVDVHCFFANVGGIAGNTFSDPSYDEDFREECIRAYNDYQIEEFGDPYPNRFITLAQVPMWDAARAVSEARRMAKRGVRGITFAMPQQFGYPHISDRHWDPLWAFAQEAQLSINFHIGSGGAMGIDRGMLSQAAPSFAGAERSTKAVSANVQVMTTLLFAGFMQRFPDLKIVSSESGVGWVPYLLEVADHHWDHANCRADGMDLPPSEIFLRQCYVNFWFESAGLKMMRDHGSLNNVMFGSDFPHPTGTWPDTRKYVERSVAGLSDEERRKVLSSNASKLYHL